MPAVQGAPGLSCPRRSDGMRRLRQERAEQDAVRERPLRLQCLPCQGRGQPCAALPGPALQESCGDTRAAHGCALLPHARSRTPRACGRLAHDRLCQRRRRRQPAGRAARDAAPRRPDSRRSLRLLGSMRSCRQRRHLRVHRHRRNALDSGLLGACQPDDGQSPCRHWHHRRPPVLQARLLPRHP